MPSPGRRRAPIDFERLARTLLDMADRLVPAWLPGGRRNGHEWTCGNLAGEPGDSCSVNLTTGAWGDFATGDKGGDLISLYAAILGLNNGQAAIRLTEELRLGPSEAAPAAPEKKRSPWSPVIPVPGGAPDAPVAHIKRGKPERIWDYLDRDGRLLGHVYRFRTSDGGKEILPLVWARHAETGAEEWHWMTWAEPRPMYGLDRIRDGHVVLIVEGEKCADAAHELLGDKLDVLSWPGGSGAVRKVDWGPIAHRKVVIWPDADAKRDQAGVLFPEPKQPGVKAAETIAAQLLELQCEVRIIKVPAPGEKPDGWDVADAIAEGATREDLLGWLKKLRPCAAQASQPAQASTATPARAGRAAEGDWQASLLRRRGEVVACLANVVQIMTTDAAWARVVGYDEFASRTVKLGPLPRFEGTCLTPGDSAEWTDVDTSYTIVWLTTAYGLTPPSNIVDEAIELVARTNSFHPVRAYLRGLTWDGTQRLSEWLADYMGVPRSEYSTRVARWYMIAMVARVMRPGVKFDYCLVLEGTQGLRKSSALRALAGDHFSDTELDLANKDSMSAIRGKWLHEFSEMGSIARVESMRQKSFLSRQIDEFRPTYGRREIRCPRQLVFAGTTNDWQWNRDPTGGRRFWPVEIAGEIDTDGLAGARDMLFAEAVAAFDAGERFWPTSQEQRDLFDPEQLKREAEDAFVDPIHDWIEGLGRSEFTLNDVLQDALKLDAGRMTRDVMTRVGMLLKKLGCTRLERRNGVSRFVYVLPAWSKYQQAQQFRQQVGDRDGPLPL